MAADGRDGSAAAGAHREEKNARASASGLRTCRGGAATARCRPLRSLPPAAVRAICAHRADAAFSHARSSRARYNAKYELALSERALPSIM